MANGIYEFVTNFGQGIMSPLLDGRVESPGYENSAKQIWHYFIMPEGGLMARKGFRRFAELTSGQQKMHFFFGLNNVPYILVYGGGAGWVCGAVGCGGGGGV